MTTTRAMKNNAMVSVKIRTFLALKKIMGKGEIELSFPEGSSLAELITTLVNRYGDELASHFIGGSNENQSCGRF